MADFHSHSPALQDAARVHGTAWLEERPWIVITNCTSSSLTIITTRAISHILPYGGGADPNYENLAQRVGRAHLHDPYYGIYKSALIAEAAAEGRTIEIHPLLPPGPDGKPVIKMLGSQLDVDLITGVYTIADNAHANLQKKGSFALGEFNNGGDLAIVETRR